MRQELPMLLLVVILFSCALILVGVNSSSDTQRTHATAYVVYPSPTTTPSSTPVTNITLEPMLKDASQRAFDRITTLLQQGNYNNYEWQQSFEYNIGLLTYHSVCELEAYRLENAVDSKDLPLIQQEYIGLDECIGELK